MTQQHTGIGDNRDFWLGQCGGELFKCRFPFDSRQEGREPHGDGAWRFTFDEPLLRRLQEVSNHSDVRLYVLLLTGVALLLAKYENREIVRLGAPIYRQEVEGSLVNTVLPLTFEIPPLQPFKTLLLAVSKGLYAANQHQNYPMETLLYKLGVPYAAGDEFPLFDVAVALDSIQDPAYLNHLRLNVRFLFSYTDEGFEGTIQYNNRYYREETVSRIASQFTRLLAQGLRDLDAPVGTLELLTSGEREDLIHRFNDTGAEVPLERSLHYLLARQVAQTPDAVALVCRNNHVSYQKLWRGAANARDSLRHQGIESDTIVAFSMPRSIEAVMAMVGIMRQGCGFLPLDPQYPQERIDFMLADSNAYPIDFSDLENFSGEGADEPDASVAGSMAYVIYTSGTTGRPKGVLVEHKNIVNTVAWFARRYGVGPGTRVLQLTDYTFDPAIEQIFAAILHGAAAYVVEKELLADIEGLRKFILTRHIHIINFIPSMLDQLLSVGDRLPSLRAVLPGGERLDEAVKERLLAKGYTVFNHYGPSETTVDALTYRCGDGSVLLGLPIDNCRCHILDHQLRLRPPGMEGEICIGGAGVAAGYLNNPQLTHQRFVHDPFFPGERLYRSGDRGRRLGDGNIQFLGRGDRQVKIKGHRIELAEIEERMMALEGITEAVALDITETGGNVYLAGYYAGDRDYSDLELREQLARQLPVYMVPLYYLRMEDIPRTPNGKVDRRAMPRPNLQGTDLYQPPANDIERRLASLWAAVLEMDEGQVGRTANFFEIGGHSLNATVLMARVHRELGIKVPMVELFRAPTIENLATYIDGAAQEALPRLQPLARQPHYPLSPAQERLYILQLLDDTGIGYNLPLLLEVKGELDEERLEAVFQALIHRHEILRSSFTVIDGRPKTRVHDHVAFTLEPSVAGMDDFVRPFDLSATPLLRVAVLEVGEQRFLAIDMHHLITDGVSMGILIREFLTLYSQEEPLPEQKLHYKDVVHWMPDLKESSTFWREQFRSAPQPIDLPLDFNRPQMQSFRGDTHFFHIHQTLTERLERVAAQTGATLFMTLLGLFNILLFRLCGQQDIVVGTPVSGRRHPDMETVVGMFVNTLALRNTVDGDEPFGDFLRRLGTGTTQALDHQDYPFEQLVEELDLPRDTGRNPLFDVMFSFENFDFPQLQIPELELIPRPIAGGASKFDLTFTVSRGSGLDCSFEYCTKLFKPGTISRFAGYFLSIAEAVAADFEARPRDIDIISSHERQWLIHELNGTDQVIDLDISFLQLFRCQVEKTPQTTALMTETGDTVSYGQLFDVAVAFGGRLRRQGVRQGDIVALVTDRSLEMMVGIYAVLLAGGAYLPIDPNYPAEGKRFILADSNPRLTLLADDLKSVWECGAGESGGEEPLPVIRGSDLAYVIYTSGSTGRPKGVMIQHNALANRLFWMQEEFPIGEGDVLIQKTPIVFDVSVWELFWWSLAGAALVVPPPGIEKDPAAMLDIIGNRGISVIHFVPSMLQVFLEVCPTTVKLPSLNYVFASGEALESSHARLFFQLFNQKSAPRLVNLYGPTEATVDVSFYECFPETLPERIPIGAPIANTRLYVLDRNLDLQPTAVAGELCVAGVQLARGYLNRPELTARSFANAGPNGENRLYKTGDHCRVNSGGRIEFLGRLDHQLKIRGFRVETGEIERWLRQHPAVEEAVVVPSGLGVERTLAAWIVSLSDWDTALLKRYLGEKLPAHMIPGSFSQLEEIPRSPSGKIDRRLLGQMAAKAENAVSPEAFVPPANPLQEIIAAAWRRVLERERVGVNDNFFDVGGNSLKIVRLAFLLQTELKRDIPVATLFRFPTVASLAVFLEKADPPAQKPAPQTHGRDRLLARRRKGTS
jgi:tyrocidine synthetase-3